MKFRLAVLVLACTLSLSVPAVAIGEAASSEGELPRHLYDRGAGIPSSLFGIYMEPRALYVYPFYEYYRDNDLEYAPDDFGVPIDVDYRGRYKANEVLIFLGYGINDHVAVELEMAHIDAAFQKAPEDTTSVPREIKESGLGDVEAQVRWRWTEEDGRRPELFSTFETVFPLQKDKLLIGTQDWEFKLGLGAIRGYRWGTMTARLAAEYAAAESKGELGEFALEYLKRLSPTWRIYLGVEGVQDEIELITEAQLHLGRSVIVKLNNAFGLTSKATDWAPEVGVMFRFDRRRASALPTTP